MALPEPDFSYPYIEERGWLFVGLWLVLTTFGIAMLFRAEDADEGDRSWRVRYGLWFLSLGSLSFASTVRFLDIWKPDTGSLIWIIHLAAVVVFSFYMLFWWYKAKDQ